MSRAPQTQDCRGRCQIQARPAGRDACRDPSSHLHEWHWPGLQSFDFMGSKFIWADFKSKRKKKRKELMMHIQSKR